jgi:hypothetical protein
MVLSLLAYFIQLRSPAGPSIVRRIPSFSVGCGCYRCDLQ